MLKYSTFVSQMKNLTIKLWAIVLVVSIILTIGVQCYWIITTFKIETKEFRREVFVSMFDVVWNLDRTETSNFLLEYQKTENNQSDDFNSFANKCTVEDDDIDKLGFFIKKSILIDDYLENLYKQTQNRLIEERIDSNTLDSLIVISFNLRNLPGDYQYAVYHPLRDTLFFTKNVIDKEDFIKNAQRVELFSSDTRKNPAYLLVYFPNQIRNIVDQILPMALFSLCLLIITSVAFIAVFRLLYKQRKLAEIENDFINNMTHEFKTPISTVALAGEALSDPVIQKHPVLMNQYINIIREENNRLGLMAEKILTTATMDKGKLKLKKEYINANEIISDVAQKFEMQIEIKDGIISLDLTSQPTTIYADKMHFTNLISNLLDNANKYSPKKPEIKIITKVTNNLLTIAVKDNGIGISKPDQKKIFEKLYRVPSGNVHNFKGFGLGLSYVQSIVTAHNGTVSVESELGKGSTFFVYLPIK
ncbi:MAG: HAMP domain-containing histidine kinase [Bacteroidales bacterium]|jgi:two-component system phosphate regulon sensor histidine kinase PhoR|nr:HAMP domain-containing histidine kinase [Bacteroidales bacterium]